MRNVIVGGLVAVWGLAVLVNGLILSPPEGEGAYGAGQYAGLALGLALAVLGIRAFLKGLGER